MIEWIRRYGQTALYLFIAAVACIIAATFLFSPKSQNQIDDYLLAQKDFDQITNLSFLADSPEKWDEAWAHLQILLERHPELKTKYDSQLAEILIVKGLPQDAQPFAEQTFQRTKKNHLPLYTSFAKTTLLIDEKQIEKAREEAQDLQQQLVLLAEHNEEAEWMREYGPLLFGYNLLRIASLEQKLNHPAAEKQAWEQLNNWLADKKQSPSKFSLTLLKTFQEGNSTLERYMEERQKTP